MARRKRIPTDTPIAYLSTPKDTRLENNPSLPIPGQWTPEGGEQVLAVLAEAGIHNYGQLLEYATYDSIASLPLEPRYVEAIHKFLLKSEKSNKEHLEREYYEVLYELSALKQPTERLAETARESGRNVAQSM